MSLSKDDILNAIAEMSVMDVVALVEAMEEKFGVSAASAVAAPAAGAAGGDNFLAHKRMFKSLESCRFDDAKFLFNILAHQLKLMMLNVERTLIFVDAIASENAHINHGTVIAAGYSEGSIFHIRGFLAKNSPE